MRKTNRLLSAVLGFVLLCACFFGCATNETTANAEELSYVSMRINPEIELVVDKEGEVVAVNAINEDGETVLCELELIGMTAEEAGEAFTAMATELGFIDVEAEEATVYILAEGKNEEFVKRLEEKLTKKINGYFDEKGIFGKVSPEVLEEFETLAVEWGVSLKDAKMVSRILELYPEMTAEEILSLDFKARIKLIQEDSVKNGFPSHLRGEYKEAVEDLKEEYSELFALRKAVEELEITLKNKELSEEERTLLQAEYEAKKAELDALKAQYKEEIEKVKSETKQKSEEIKQEIKDKAQELREDFSEKLKEHEDRFKEEKEEIEEQIKQWRDKHR